MDHARIHALAQDRRQRAARHRRRARLVLLVLGAVLLAHALVGENGLVALWRARRQYETVQAELVRLRAERDRLRERARRLREDPAAIEELARRELGLVRPGETLVFVVPGQPARVR